MAGGGSNQSKSKKKDSSSSDATAVTGKTASSKSMVSRLLTVVFIVVGTISSIVCAYFVMKSFLPKASPKHVNKPVTVARSSSNAAQTQQPVSLQWKQQPDPKLHKYHNLPTWGTYRPGYYFGMKTSQTGVVQSASGIMWTDSGHDKFRHDTNQGELTKFEWTEHDGKHYGKQELIDNNMALQANTTFVVPKGTDDAAQTWFQHISMKSTVVRAEQAGPLSLLFYLSGECADEASRGNCVSRVSMKEVEVQRFETDGKTGLQIAGRNEVNGYFVLSVAMDADSGSSLSYAAISDADVKIGSERLKSEFRSCMSNAKARGGASCGLYDAYGDLSTSVEEAPSFLAIQASFAQSVQLYVSFQEHMTVNEWKAVQIQPAVRSEQHVAVLHSLSAKYSEAFQEKFGAMAASIDMNNFSKDQVHSVQIALSSLLGGVGYFEGTPAIEFEVRAALDLKDFSLLQNDVALSKASRTSLLTGTPSRTVFPRGFLWDEGFHQMVMSHWEVDITLRVLSDWLNAMYLSPKPSLQAVSEPDMMGWIPREMILGEDATRRVPNEFVVQRVTIANPPTFLLVLESLLNRINPAHADFLDTDISTSERDRILTFVHDIFPRLHYWITWFAFTQQGEVAASYRWRGRSASDSKVIPNTLASGLDDYPRAIIPTFEERHVDMHCWMMKAYEIMATIEKTLLRTNAVIGAEQQRIMQKTKYEDLFQQVQGALDQHHWSEEYKGYFDFGMNNESASFVKEVLFRCANPVDNGAIDGYVPIELLQQSRSQSINFCPQSHPKPMYPLGDGNGGYLMRERVVAEGYALDFIPRVGYVSIFPLLLKSLPATSNKLGAVLDMVENRTLLWTSYGLRSIATSDTYYLRRNAPGDAPYWRGPIWINVNYLALSALHHYSKQEGPSQARCVKLYNQLRSNLLRNILNEHKRTGFFWEQYDDQNGQGIRGHPFTGWTATVVNIFLEKY